METINHECYVSLEVAKLLEQAGFYWGCREYYPTNCMTNRYEEYAKPTLEVAQRWLRENKNFDINILTDFDSVKRLYYVRYVVKDGHYKTYYITNNRSYVYFNTYEEALEASIKKGLEMISK